MTQLNLGQDWEIAVDAPNNRLLVEYTPTTTQFELNEDGTLKPLDGGVDTDLLNGADLANASAGEIIQSDGDGTLSTAPPSTPSFSASGYTEVSSSRSEGTEYQNTTGNPLEVSVIMNANGGEFASIQIQTNSVSGLTGGDAIEDARDPNATSSWRGTVHAIIPDGWYYQVSIAGGIIQFWNEQELENT